MEAAAIERHLAAGRIRPDAEAFGCEGDPA
jgi:hypothetical protein